MSRLEELIQELCPNGVEYSKIGTYVDYKQPTKYIVKSTDYNNDFPTPVLTAGQTFILGYTNEKEGIYNASKESPVIIFDDFTGAFKWVDFDFKVKSSAMKILTAKNNMLIRYLFHCMGYLNFTSNEHKRLWIGTYSDFEIPVPPLEVQREIVQILDNFTTLTAELQTKLQAELQARKKQYEYYRDKLLNFETNIHKEKLKSVAKISRGVRVTKSQLTDNGYPVYQNALIPMGYHSEYNVSGGATYVISAGAAGEIGFSDENFWAADDCLVFTELNGVTNKYIYHFLMTKKNYIKTRVRKASIPRLPREVIENLLIPTPSIEIQNKIVDILDNFEKICSDLNIGLPAEIEARQKQYEYYRDALLSFDNSYFVNVERERERERKMSGTAD